MFQPPAPVGDSEAPAGPAAVEIHGLDAGCSLVALRSLFGQCGNVLQLVAALDGDPANSQGLALCIYASERAARAAVELLDSYPLGNSFLHVKRADTLPNSLINLLYSLEQPTSMAAAAAAESQANAAAAQAFLERQQMMQQAEHQRARHAQEAQAQAWDASQRQQASAPGQASHEGWAGGFDRPPGGAGGPPPPHLGNGLAAANGHGLGQNGAASLAHQQQLEVDLRQLQLDRQQQAAAAAASLPPPQPPPPQQQPQRPAAMSWASAAAAAPSLAALAARPANMGGSLTAGNSSATGSGSGPDSDWQMASGSRGRTGRRGAGLGAGSVGRAGSSVSSGSPRPMNRSSGRRSDDRPSRPGGQDGASPDPTTKLWMGGIDGSASAETVRAVFGRFGPIYDYELQPATHEKGRTDQWGFVNFKRLGDATRAYETLVGEVIPELTGTRKLKLQFRPVDTRRTGGSSGGRR